MNRRDLFRAAAAAAVVPAIEGSSSATLETEIVRLKLRHTWTTVMSSSDFRDVLYVRYTRDGITGHGEGAPIVRYKEDAKSAQAALESVRPLILNSALADSDVFIAAWLPGTEGRGVTDVLFGDFKFTGKSPRNWPRSNEHIASADKPEKPLFPFGFGLSH